MMKVLVFHVHVQGEILGKVYKTICPIFIRFQVSESSESLHAACIKRDYITLVRHLVRQPAHQYEELIPG